VALWSLRLGTYIALRVAKGGHEDTRYAGLKKEWGKAYQARMFWFMQIQAPATVALCVSILLAASNPAPGLGLTDLIGGLILLGSIVGEAVADQQMAAFRADPSNKGKVCDAGLWGWSRHPNYFFEFLGWVAYPVMAFDPANLLWVLTLVAPAAMYGLLRFGTGVPPLEAAMLRSRGDVFRAYQARVPVFIPFPPPRSKSPKTA
jgi:steroid 5-alpha reductase family enzyme